MAADDPIEVFMREQRKKLMVCLAKADLYAPGAYAVVTAACVGIEDACCDCLRTKDAAPVERFMREQRKALLAVVAKTNLAKPGAFTAIMTAWMVVENACCDNLEVKTDG